MLGLRRHIVELAEPCSDWSTAFSSEEKRISDAAVGIDLVIEHIGSTAVPDLPAKPIIDIGVLLRCEAQREALMSAVSSLGYIDRGDKGSEGGHLFVREQEPMCGHIMCISSSRVMMLGIGTFASEIPYGATRRRKRNMHH